MLCETYLSEIAQQTINSKTKKAEDVTILGQRRKFVKTLLYSEATRFVIEKFMSNKEYTTRYTSVYRDNFRYIVLPTFIDVNEFRAKYPVYNGPGQTFHSHLLTEGILEVRNSIVNI